MATPRVDVRSQFDGQRGAKGFRLCRQCGTECPNARRTYCSTACSDQWALERWPSTQHQAVFERDKGVCETCGVDAHRLGERVRSLLLRMRDIAWKSRGRSLMRLTRAGRRLERIVQRYHRKWTFSFSFYVPNSFWEMDHRVPLAEDGTNALDNLRTLCCACHRAETKALAGRLAEVRRLAKGQGNG